MGSERGNEKEPELDLVDEDEDRDAGGLFPDMARRALAFGLSGFFLTEETIRKAVGDTLPKDWQDFVVGQSERTRKEFMERLSAEMAQTLEKIDVAEVLDELLAGRTVEVQATFRLGERRKGASPHKVRVGVKGDEDDE
jgi:hypothetical protein